MQLHSFGDASIIRIIAAAYTVIQQTSSTTQGFIPRKSRLSKKNSSIPRLKLIATVMVGNCVENIANSLQRFKVTSVHGWSEYKHGSSLWLKGNGTYKQFLQNLIDQLNSKAQIQWHFVSTDENLAEIG